MASWSVEYAKSGRSTCKRSKETIEKGEIRFGKTTTIPSDDGSERTMQNWFKAIPFFQMLAAMKKTTPKPAVDDMAGFDTLTDDDQGKVEKVRCGRARTQPESKM